MDPTVQFYLREVEYPVLADVVATTFDSQGLPWYAAKIREADTLRFDSPEEVMEALGREPSYRYNRDNYHDPPS